MLLVCYKLNFKFKKLFINLFNTEVFSVMSFPTKDQRNQCWTARDRYWECLDSHQVLDKSKANTKVCEEFRKLFEQGCPSQWVKHFDRKREYLKYKEKIEKHGYEPLDEVK